MVTFICSLLLVGIGFNEMMHDSYLGIIWVGLGMLVSLCDWEDLCR